MKKRNKKLELLLLTLVFVAYLPMFKGFFQHDEWRAFGNYLSGGGNLLSMLKPFHSHYTPLTEIFFNLYLSFFQLNFFWYALFSVIAHLIVVYLSFVFFSKLLKNRILAFFSSLLFAIGASSHQATSWIAADINTHGSTIFGLLALIVLYKSNKIWLSIVFLIISLLFKESTIAFFVLLPLMIYIFDKKKFIANKLNYIRITLIGFLYLAFRYLLIVLQKTQTGSVVKLVTETQSLLDVMGNLITFPAKIFSHSLFPTGLLLSFARNISKILPTSITGLYGTTAFDVFVENTALQIINWIIFSACIFLLIYVTKKSKNTRIKKVALFGFVFVILNSFIYTLSPGRSGNIPVVDSRNIYLPSIGAAIFLVSAIYLFLKEKTNKTFLIIAIFVVLNIFWLEKELKFIAERGTERKEILYQIKESYPVLPKETVFYMESDKSFYGFPETEKMFPFEVNFGYTLMVWYQPTEQFSKQLTNQTYFLRKLTDEGYKEVEGRGFGYFRNLEPLIQAMKDNNLKKDSVIGFSYHFDDRSIEDITPQIRKEIEVMVGKTK